mgnify:CR=1 FL=1
MRLVRTVSILALAVLVDPVSGQVSDPDEETREKLRSARFSIEADGDPFEDLIQAIRDTARLDIVYDPEAARRIAESKGTITIDNLSLDAALCCVLDLQGLDYDIRDGVIVVSTGASLRERLRSATYEIGDLMAELAVDPFPSGEPAGRTEGPSPSALGEFLGPIAAPGALVVEPHAIRFRGTQAEQESLEWSLEKLREHVGRTYQIEILRGRGPVPTEAEEKNRVFRGPLLAGRTARQGDELQVQLLPLSAPGAIRLRLAASAGAAPLPFAAEWVVPLATLTTLATRGDEWLAAIVHPWKPNRREQVLARLESTTVDSIDFKDEPLVEAIEFLRDEFDVNIMIDAGLPAAEIRISMKVSSVSLRAAIDLLCTVGGLRWWVAQGVVVLGGQKSGSEEFPRIYDVRPGLAFFDAMRAGAETAIVPDGLGTGRLGPVLFARGTASDHVRLALFAGRPLDASPRTLRATLRTEAGEASLLLPSGRGVRIDLVPGEAWTRIRASLGPKDAVVVEIDGPGFSRACPGEAGKWIELPGGRAIRIEDAKLFQKE